MEKWIKITQSNFQLFSRNEDLIVFLTILRLCDAEGCIDTTISNFLGYARYEKDIVLNSLETLSNQDLLLYDNTDETLNIIVNVEKSKWWGGDVIKQKKPKKALSEIEIKFRARLNIKFPRIAKMREPLLLEEYNKLKEYYTDEVIIETMEDMDNWAKLSTKISAYRTLSKWLKNKHG